MLGLIVGAAILMLILAVMEGGEMPDWLTMILCVLAITIPAVVVEVAVGPELWFGGPIFGAFCGALAISALWGMAVKRAAIASTLYLVIQIGISFALYGGS